jgi:hypothetical protein
MSEWPEGSYLKPRARKLAPARQTTCASRLSPQTVGRVQSLPEQKASHLMAVIGSARM